jgi:Transposase DDE domain group 1
MAPRSKRCLSRRTDTRQSRSFSISTPPTTCCTGIKKAASFTVITTVTAICRCTSFCGRHLLAAKQRCANIDAPAGAVKETARIVAQIRTQWPKMRIVLRADSRFARDALVSWCEANGGDFLFGWPRTSGWSLRLPVNWLLPRKRGKPAASRRVVSAYFRQLVVGKIGEFVQTQWHEHGSSGRHEAPSG